jgi:hypothetical protein
MFRVGGRSSRAVSKFRITSADQSFAEHPQARADFHRFQWLAVDFNRQRFIEIDQALVRKRRRS